MNCAGLAWAELPKLDYDGCERQKQPRCVIYTGPGPRACLSQIPCIPFEAPTDARGGGTRWRFFGPSCGPRHRPRRRRKGENGAERIHVLRATGLPDPT